MTKRIPPTIFIASLNVIVFAVINGFQLITQIPIHYVNKWIMPGVDYQDFYQASLQTLNGRSPYLVERFVTPPLFALANIPLALFSFEVARALFMFLIPCMVLFSYLLIARGLKASALEENDWFVPGGILVILFSYPFYFLFERGNIDGVVLLFMCLGLCSMPKRPWLGGLLLAAAIHFKLYPILFVIPLLLARRWQPLFWTCAWVLIFALVTAPYWGDFAILLSRRSNSFQLFENGSLVNTSLFLGRLVGSFFGKNELFWTYAPLYAATLYALFLGILMLTDYKLSHALTPGQHIANALLYVPFMVALPKSVYHYEFVVLIVLLPVLDYLWSGTVLPSERFALGMITVGVALSQWQAVALYTLTENTLAYYIPGLGLLLVMAGISAYKFMQLRQNTQKPFPEKHAKVVTSNI
jgi:uncharacterized membrane protein